MFENASITCYTYRTARVTDATRIPRDATRQMEILLALAAAPGGRPDNHTCYHVSYKRGSASDFVVMFADNTTYISNNTDNLIKESF